MTSQVLNFLWLNLELPARRDPRNGSIHSPLPVRYIENARKTGEAHPAAEIDFWVDSKRLTEKQMAYLTLSLEEGLPNVHLKDLRSIPAYDKEPLYNEAEKNHNWRDDWAKTSLIWRQVDAAKVLISLQGGFDQTFFADLDHAHLDIESQEVQDKLRKPGLFIGSGFENQLWGFTRSRHGFFEEYYKTALDVAYDGDNAWWALTQKVRAFASAENISGEQINIYLPNDGTCAEQPGSKWRFGFKKKANPSLISRRTLAKLFNESGNGAYASLSTSRGGAWLGMLTGFEHKSRKNFSGAAP